jgi:hypothetical protein
MRSDSVLEAIDILKQAASSGKMDIPERRLPS